MCKKERKIIIVKHSKMLLFSDMPLQHIIAQFIRKYGVTSPGLLTVADGWDSYAPILMAVCSLIFGKIFH